MAHVEEFRRAWRPFSGATLGLAFGYTFNNYVANVFAPHLIAEFGWQRSDFALLGLVTILAIFCQPVAGQLADALGTRRTALIGVAAAPLLYVALSMLGGPFWQFAAISVAQVVLVGATTTIVVYTRQIAHAFDKARGLALGIAASAPAIAGAAFAPILVAVIAAAGWRSAYLVAGLGTAVFGGIALLLIPRDRPRLNSIGGRPWKQKVDYAALLRSRPFQLIICGTLLCNLTITLQMSQISVVLEDLGVTGSTAGLMISLYGIGVIAGRVLCGFALDRFAPHLVAAIAMAAPAVGLIVLASGTTNIVAISFAIATLGLSLGAEGDVGAYLVMRYFPLAIYSSVVGLVVAALAASGAAGSMLLSATLASTGAFSTFLLISAAAAIAGSLLFLILGRYPAREADLADASPAALAAA